MHIVALISFPVYIHVFGHALHPHPVMEVIAYTCGFQFYLLLRRRWTGVKIPFEQNMWLIVGAIFGALAGSKLLAWVESPYEYFGPHAASMACVGGKTIVGGLLGGWAGVEIAKRIIGITARTGDVYVFPLILGMSIGRIGCFLTGLPDHTYGKFTRLPWGVNFGDGRRHPTQLYDIVFLLILAAALRVRMRWPYETGRLFRLFLLSYLLYRYCVEFIKPRFNPYLGLSAIQLACLLGAAVVYFVTYRRRPDRSGPLIGANSSDAPAPSNAARS